MGEGMSRRISLALTFAVLLLATPNVAEAYIGPGAGLSAIGTIIALVGAILLAVVGFVWYPVKRVLRKRAERRAKAQKTDKPSES